MNALAVDFAWPKSTRLALIRFAGASIDQNTTSEKASEWPFTLDLVAATRSSAKAPTRAFFGDVPCEQVAKVAVQSRKQSASFLSINGLVEISHRSWHKLLNDNGCRHDDRRDNGSNRDGLIHRLLHRLTKDLGSRVGRCVTYVTSDFYTV